MLPLRALLACALLASSGGCKVTAEDIEYWQGTVKGPGKILAVLLSENYPLELRTQAALALVEMDRSDVKGVEKLQQGLQELAPETRQQIITGMLDGLDEQMRGGDSAQDASGAPPPAQVRAKDAAYLLIAHAQGETRDRLVTAVVGWYVVDFNGRSLAGDFSAEQVIRSLGSQAAEMLVDALSAEMPQRALVKVAELIAQLGSAEAKGRAAARLVEIEQRMETEEFVEWLRSKIREQIRITTPDAPIDEPRVNAIATLNRENFINDGALPAIKHLATEAVAAEHLLTIASITSTDEAVIERRKRALQALEGNATRAHLDRLLALALSNDNPVPVRDYAFDRVGDIRAPEAIPPMWPLVEGQGSEDAQRLRWRAGEMVLAIGGPAVVAEFFARLPTARDIAYEPEELEGYATRMSQMTPPPTELVRAQLASPDWWDRVIALRYFERKGAAGDVAQMRRLERDTAAVAGERWRGMHLENVGDVAEQAIAGLQERLSGGGQQAAGGAAAEDGAP